MTRLSPGERNLLDQVVDYAKSPLDSSFLKNQVIPGESSRDLSTFRGMATAAVSYDLGRGIWTSIPGEDGANGALSAGMYFGDDIQIGARNPDLPALFYKRIGSIPLEIAALTDMATCKYETVTTPNPRYREPEPVRWSWLRKLLGKPAETTSPTEPMTLTWERADIVPLEHPQGGRAVRFAYVIPGAQRFNSDRPYDGSLTEEDLTNAGGLVFPLAEEAVTTIIPERVATNLGELMLKKPAVNRWLGHEIMDLCIPESRRRSLSYYTHQVWERYPKTPEKLQMRIVFGDVTKKAPVHTMESVRVGGDMVEE